MHTFRRHLSYANITATLALVFAMSGGALAARHYLINSTRQINPKVLRKLKGATGRTGATGRAGAAGSNGSNGANGTNGTNGERGPSTAFSVQSNLGLVDFSLTPEAMVTVASLSLPAGSFSIEAKVAANDNTGTALVGCELLAAGGVIDAGENLTLAAAAPGDRGYFALANSATLTSPGNAQINCKSSTTQGNYLDWSITAIQVASTR
jgi:hypothetical protein